jgi:hypothetical protein
LLSVYFDGEQIFGFENVPFGLGPGDELSSGPVWLGEEYAPGPYALTFRLDPLEELQASLEISDTRLLSFIAATAPTLAGDFNADGQVNAADLSVWRNNFGVSGATRAQGDADGDADVDGNDFLVWQGQVGAVGAAAVQSAVPEPAAGALLVVGACSIVLRGRRQARRSAP